MSNLPVCEKCNKQVDKIIRSDEGNKIIFEAECHGEKEIHEIDRAYLVDAERVRIGRAFES